MEFVQPEQEGYTVFTKRECGDCEKVKALFQSKQIKYVAKECDDYLVGATRASFIQHLQHLMHAVTPVRFPLVFANGAFIGGFVATRQHLEDEDW